LFLHLDSPLGLQIGNVCETTTECRSCQPPNGTFVGRSRIFGPCCHPTPSSATIPYANNLDLSSTEAPVTARSRSLGIEDLDRSFGAEFGCF
jgi:hypothetical protein